MVFPLGHLPERRERRSDYPPFIMRCAGIVLGHTSAPALSTVPAFIYCRAQARALPAISAAPWTGMDDEERGDVAMSVVFPVTGDEFKKNGVLPV